MREQRPTVTIMFDGEEVEAFTDETVLQAARRNNVFIPSLCFVEGLSVWGGCRLCMIEIEEDRKMRPACATPINPEMEVYTMTSTGGSVTNRTNNAAFDFEVSWR